jgi:hypothetical protein
MRNYLADPEGTKTVLASLPKNQALEQIISVTVKDTDKTPQSVGNKSELMAAQKRAAVAIQAAHPGMSWQDAWNEARATRKELFPAEV